jgi:hypothetical protein
MMSLKYQKPNKVLSIHFRNPLRMIKDLKWLNNWPKFSLKKSTVLAK